MTEEKKNLSNYMEASEEVARAYEELEKLQKEEEDNFWNSLTESQKQRAFGAVVRRIVEGDIKQKGSYRYVLYNVFEFGLDSYIMGMNCGYMTLHNSIMTTEQEHELLEEFAEFNGLSAETVSNYYKSKY